MSGFGCRKHSWQNGFPQPLWFCFSGDENVKLSCPISKRRCMQDWVDKVSIKSAKHKNSQILHLKIQVFWFNILTICLLDKTWFEKASFTNPFPAKEFLLFLKFLQRRVSQTFSQPEMFIFSSSVQFSSVQDGICAVHPVYQKFPQHCLWNGSSVYLIDDFPSFTLARKIV